MYCEQKYCKNCVKPIFNDKDNKFLRGRCKISRYVVLESNCDEAKELTLSQPLYCKYYIKRKRRINY